MGVGKYPASADGLGTGLRNKSVAPRRQGMACRGSHADDPAKKLPARGGLAEGATAPFK